MGLALRSVEGGCALPETLGAGAIRAARGEVHLRQKRPVPGIRAQRIEDRIAQERNDEWITHLDRAIQPLEAPSIRPRPSEISPIENGGT